MFDLILDVIKGFCQLRDAHTESAITLLPAKVVQLSKSLVNPADDPAFINRMAPIVPLGLGYFPHDWMHFVPSLGTKTIRPSKRLALSWPLWVETLG